jgi:glycerol-3-phosphate acyltransferase PlsY
VVAIVDIGKGAVAVYIAQVLGVSQYWVLGAGFAAIVGHNYPVFVGFKGGKGAATVIGVMLVIAPVSMGIALTAIGIGWLIIRHLFTTIAIAAIVLSLATWFVEQSAVLLIYILVIILFIVFRVRRRLPEIKIARTVNR